jgi:hypothetical protein
VKLDLHIQGAFDTLAAAEVSEAAFLDELRARGHSMEDSQLALEKALMEGLLERLPNGALRRRSGSLQEELRSGGPDDVSAPTR